MKFPAKSINSSKSIKPIIIIMILLFNYFCIIFYNEILYFIFYIHASISKSQNSAKCLSVYSASYLNTGPKYKKVGILNNS